MSDAPVIPQDPRDTLGMTSYRRTDFRSWGRDSLERFAREAADENLLLRADLKSALAGWRNAVCEAERDKARAAAAGKGA